MEQPDRPKSRPKPDPTPESKPQAKPEPQAKPKQKAKPEPQAKPAPKSKPNAKQKPEPSDSLTEYRRKRRFERTPEPTGETAAGTTTGTTGETTAETTAETAAEAGLEESGPGSGDQGPLVHRFVVQEHHARRLHWDFRLEHDGVLVSWALPRGFPMTTEKNRLAVHTEDHPMEYLDFQGEIPAGEYGGGSMKVWDHGTYETEKFREREVIIRVHGEKVTGRFVLFRTDGKNWMIHRMDAPPEGWEQIPPAGSITPSRAEPGELPEGEPGWAYEVLWGGLRVIAYAEPGHLTVIDADGEDVTKAFPELGRMTRAVGGRFAVLDGELVAFDRGGRPDPARLERRKGLRSEADIRRRSRETPVTLIAYDLLYLDGHGLTEESYEERRRLLDELGLSGESWQTPAYFTDGPALKHASAEQGLPGIVAKRLTSPYRTGENGGDWIMVENDGG